MTEETYNMIADKLNARFFNYSRYLNEIKISDYDIAFDDLFKCIRLLSYDTTTCIKTAKESHKLSLFEEMNLYCMLDEKNKELFNIIKNH